MCPTPEQDPVGDNMVTIIFPGKISVSDFAGGYTRNGLVNSDQNPVDDTNPFNAAEARELSPNVDTTGPDLVSVKRDGDTFLFEFDKPLDPDQVTLDSGSFVIYFPEDKTIRSLFRMQLHRELPL